MIKDYIKRNNFVRKYKLYSYDKIINSSEWRDLKKYLKSNTTNYTACIICGKGNPHLHHILYTKHFFKQIKSYKGGKPPRRLVKHLKPLCGYCHKSIHDIEKANSISIYEATKRYAKSLDKWRDVRFFTFKYKQT